ADACDLERFDCIDDAIGSYRDSGAAQHAREVHDVFRQPSGVVAFDAHGLRNSRVPLRHAMFSATSRGSWESQARWLDMMLGTSGQTCGTHVSEPNTKRSGYFENIARQVLESAPPAVVIPSRCDSSP